MGCARQIVRLLAAHRATGSYLLVAVLANGSANADPVVGATLHMGESIAGLSDWRVGSALYLVRPLEGGWQVGGELRGSMEAYTGGYGCGTIGNDVEAVPSLAVVCFQPSVAAHSLVGVRMGTTSSSLVFQLGAGAATTFLVPGKGGDTQRATSPSFLLRAAYLFEVGGEARSTWSVGVALEEQAVGICGPRFTGAIGLLIEARSR